MRKTIKGLSAILITSVLAVSASAATVGTMTASAEDKKMSVSSITDDQATHSFNAYQIFTGELVTIDSKKQLININWKTGVDGAAIITALKASTAFGSTNPFDGISTSDANSAAKVANVLVTFESDSANTDAFADVLDGVLAAATEGATPLGTAITLPTDAAPGPGYYFIKDTITTKPSTGKQYAYSNHILKVHQDEDLNNIAPKADVPTIDKKIGTDYTTGTKVNAVSIGDSVPFVLKSRVPDMSKYNDYYFIIQDDLCNGFTFNNDVSITIGTKTLVKDTDYSVVTTGLDSTYDFKIVFTDFYEKYNNATYKDADIIVKYTATLDEDADLSATGNPNEVDLTFSNNPNHIYGGGNEPTTDEKTNDDVIGVTPKSKTVTFTTGLKLLKQDAVSKAALEGAKFQITGDGVKAVIINDHIFKAVDTSGTHWMLKNGTFTTEDPADKSDAVKATYDSLTQKYIEIADVIKTTAPATTSVNQTAYTNASGLISFAGLGAGTYTITELAPPKGYNAIAPFNITIEVAFDNANLATSTPTWTVKKGTTDLTAGTDNLYAFTVDNNKGIELPGTGGVGTTIFYIVGGLMISGALVLLIVKKRMSIKEK